MSKPERMDNLGNSPEAKTQPVYVEVNSEFELDLPPTLLGVAYNDAWGESELTASVRVSEKLAALVDLKEGPRYCPGCPDKMIVLEKGKQLCNACRNERRARTLTESQRKHRATLATVSVNKSLDKLQKVNSRMVDLKKQIQDLLVADDSLSLSFGEAAEKVGVPLLLAESWRQTDAKFDKIVTNHQIATSCEVLVIAHDLLRSRRTLSVCELAYVENARGLAEVLPDAFPSAGFDFLRGGDFLQPKAIFQS
jgi:hypothetical protein